MLVALYEGPPAVPVGRTAMAGSPRRRSGAGPESRWTLRAAWSGWTYPATGFGAIPQRLSHLRGLNLGGNDLSGAIPPDWAACRIWSRLYLYSNDLSGAIPPELGGLSNLRGLYLGGNDLSGAIPAELGGLSNLLGSLSLEWNDLSGAIPAELGNLSNLGWLDLDWNNDLSGAIPPELGGLSNLGSLSLGGNDFLARFRRSWATCRIWGICTSTGTTFLARFRRSWGIWPTWCGCAPRERPLPARFRELGDLRPGATPPLRPDPPHVRRTGEPDRAGAVAQRGVGRSHAGRPEEPGAGVARGERHGALRAAGTGVRGVAPDHPQAADRGVRGASGGVPGAGGAVARAPGSACGGGGCAAARLRHGGDGDDRGDARRAGALLPERYRAACGGHPRQFDTDPHGDRRGRPGDVGECGDSGLAHPAWSGDGRRDRPRWRARREPRGSQADPSGGPSGRRGA